MGMRLNKSIIEAVSKFFKNKPAKGFSREAILKATKGLSPEEDLELIKKEYPHIYESIMANKRVGEIKKLTPEELLAKEAREASEQEAIAAKMREPSKVYSERAKADELYLGKPKPPKTIDEDIYETLPYLKKPSIAEQTLKSTESSLPSQVDLTKPLNMTDEEFNEILKQIKKGTVK